MSLHANDDFSIPAETVRVGVFVAAQGQRVSAHAGRTERWVLLWRLCQLVQPARPAGGSAVAAGVGDDHAVCRRVTDRQAAEAVATRIDWKYVLGLELTAPSFDYSILSEFRDRPLHRQAEQLLLEASCVRFRELGLLRGRGRQRTDSTHVLAAVRLA